MKEELAKEGVELIDNYGIIQAPKNALEHLSVSYPWSVSSPSEITELLLATQGKKEANDILIRTIGQEIMLTRQGYQTGVPNDGYENKRIYVEGKKKTIQIPDPQRSKYYLEMFNLRASGLYTDPEIVEKLNHQGFKTKIKNKWDGTKTKIIGHMGGIPLSVKQLQKILINPIYAGVICEKWTNNLPIRAQYSGIITIELFNKANRGKIFIKEGQGGELEIVFNHNPNRSKRRNKENPLFPFKFILCPLCRKPFTGSSPPGKSGKHFPCYHCSRDHKYFGINKKTFEDNVDTFLKKLRFSTEYLGSLEASLLNKFREKQGDVAASSAAISSRIAEMESEIDMATKAYIQTQNTYIRNNIESQISKLEDNIKRARCERDKIEIKEDDIREFINEVRYLMEHPGEIVSNQDNFQARQSLFGLFFEDIPTYFEIINGTPKLSWIFRLSETNQNTESLLAAPTGFEPVLHE